MPPTPSDAALRRVVARLAEQDGADVQAVLDRLEPSHRLRIHTLLKTCLNAGSDVSPTPVSEISPWLAARMGRPGSDQTQPTSWSMTEAARASLLRAGARLPQPTSNARPRSIANSWFVRGLTSPQPR